MMTMFSLLLMMIMIWYLSLLFFTFSLNITCQYAIHYYDLTMMMWWWAFLLCWRWWFALLWFCWLDLTKKNVVSYVLVLFCVCTAEEEEKIYMSTYIKVDVPLEEKNIQKQTNQEKCQKVAGHYIHIIVYRQHYHQRWVSVLFFHKHWVFLCVCPSSFCNSLLCTLERHNRTRIFFLDEKVLYQKKYSRVKGIQRHYEALIALMSWILFQFLLENRCTLL